MVKLGAFFASSPVPIPKGLVDELPDLDRLQGREMVHEIFFHRVFVLVGGNKHHLIFCS